MSFGNKASTVNKSEFITGYERHTRDSRSRALRLFALLVAGGFVIAGFNLLLEPRYPTGAPIFTLGLIVTLVVASCLAANAAIRNSASTHGLCCLRCGKMLGQFRVAVVAIETGKCEFCGHVIFNETESAEQGIPPNDR